MLVRRQCSRRYASGRFSSRRYSVPLYLDDYYPDYPDRAYYPELPPPDYYPEVPPIDYPMAVATRRSWFEDDLLPLRHRDSLWGRDDWITDREWKDWPRDWPRPRDLMNRFWRDTDRWWQDWPSDWPRMDAVMPRFTSHLDSMDRNWRNDPFWADIYPRWAEPIFKEGIDVNARIVNDESRFGVEVDCYQFRPEEIQVKTLDDTLLIEGRHEDVRDRDNFTKMYFVRKYQLPRDVDPSMVQSNIDARGRLTVEAPRRNAAIMGRERAIPIEGPSRYSPRTRNDSGFSNGFTSSRSAASPIHVETGSTTGGGVGREIRIEREYNSSRSEEFGRREREEREFREREAREREVRERETREREVREREAAAAAAAAASAAASRAREESRSRDNGNYSSSYSYQRSESRQRLSPHDVTISNENRAYDHSPRSPRTTFETNRDASEFSPGSGRSIVDSIRDKFEKGGRNVNTTWRATLPSRFRSQSRGSEFREAGSRSESRNERREFNSGYNSDSRSGVGYRVESPASITTGILRNGGAAAMEPRSESRSESVRSVQISRKTYN